MDGTTRFLERPEGRLAYELVGTRGPLVVCAPGLGDLRQQFRLLAPALVEAGARVVSLDLRGQGESSTGFADLSARAVGSDLVALLEQLGEPAVLVGNSLAAGAAVWAAAEAPARVRGLVLLGPAVHDLPLSLGQRLLMALATGLLFRGPWGPAAWAAYYGSLYPGRKPADFAAYRARLVANLREPGRMAALRGMIAASKAEVAARLGEARVPTLTVMGTRDPDFPDPAAEARWVRERVGGELLLVDGAGHYPHVERPELVAPAVVELVRALGASGRAA